MAPLKTEQANIKEKCTRNIFFEKNTNLSGTT